MNYLLSDLHRVSRVVFLGDFCISGEVIQSELSTIRIDPWAGLRRIFPEDAPIIANLECPFTLEPNGLPFKWANLKTSPELHWMLDGLSMAVLGNNHIADFGHPGVLDTKRLLASKDISYLGYGETLNDALKPSFLDLGGNRLGVVSLCCPTTNGENLATHRSSGVAPLGMATLKQAVEGARSQCDGLVVYLHWGCEWVHDPAPDQLRLARHAIDCGADAVIGSHSHTIQSYEQYRGRWIFYGLGNYLFEAAYGQAVRENGTIERVPLTLEPSNRESLAVSFIIVPDNGSGRLRLDRVEGIRFGNDWVPRSIGLAALTFDLDAANRRLRGFVARHEQLLCDRSEPVFRALLRNGIIAYLYSGESIDFAPLLTESRPLRGIYSRLRSIVGWGLRRLRTLSNSFCGQ